MVTVLDTESPGSSLLMVSVAPWPGSAWRRTPAAASLAPVHGIPVTDASTARPTMTAPGITNRLNCAIDVRVGTVVAMVMPRALGPGPPRPDHTGPTVW